ncbi:MAG: hypothetical protein MUC77_01250 [Chromatiaceae bacterium]|nr:hypothetical protein [Chromatiaceae bacterium]
MSAYALSGQGNFSCTALSMVPATVQITNPSVLGGNAIDWVRTDPLEVDVVAVADSSGKRCVYNYGPGATGGKKLTPNSANAVSQVLACKDGLVIPPPNTVPTVEILTPMEDGTTYAGGDAIDLNAIAEDAQDGLIAAIAWSSSLEGSLGNGGSLTKVLRPGVHTITAQVQDSGGLLGADSVTVTVEAVVVAECETIDGGGAVLINGTAVSCPSDGMGGFLPRVVCSADLSASADKFALANQGCCVCGVKAVECDPNLPSSAEVAPGQPGPCPVIKPGFDNLQVPTTILFNNDPYYCTTIGGRRTCYAY